MNILFVVEKKQRRFYKIIKCEFLHLVSYFQMLFSLVNIEK